MTEEVKQLTIFDIPEDPVENLKQAIIYKSKNDKGYWIDILNHLVFVHNDGTYEYLPNESYAPDYYTVTLNRRWRVPKNAKRFLTLKDAVKDAYFKLCKKPNGTIYTICYHYETHGEKYEKRKSNVTRSTLIFLKKRNDEIVFENYELEKSIFYFNKLMLTYEEKKELVKNNHIPSEWMKKPRVNPKIEILESELKQKYNVASIFYKKQLTNKEKIDFLKTLKGYYTVLTKVVDVTKIAPVHIVIQDVRSGLADYNINQKTIRLRWDSIHSFFHEYFHHIDFQTGIRKFHQKKNKNNMMVEYSDYFALIEKLTDMKTISSFINEHKKRFEEWTKMKDKSSSFNYHIKKSKAYYMYFLQSREITARFFSDYMFFFYQDELESLIGNETHRSRNLSFEEEEIVACKHYVDSMFETSGLSSQLTNICADK